MSDTPFDVGFKDTEAWLDSGAPEGMRPAPPVELNELATEEWWRGNNAAIDTHKIRVTSDAEAFSKFEDIVVCAICFGFFLLGCWLLFSSNLATQAVGLGVALLAAKIIKNVESYRSK